MDGVSEQTQASKVLESPDLPSAEECRAQAIALNDDPQEEWVLAEIEVVADVEAWQ
ncbi:MAG: DUF3018 family protein [Gammaproteobacteria bacterium]|nr:DUF3018 family protein [Gammaproteobacteria bacterium]